MSYPKFCRKPNDIPEGIQYLIVPLKVVRPKVTTNVDIKITGI